MSVHILAVETASLCRSRLDVDGLERIHEAQIVHRADLLAAGDLRWPWQRRRALREAERRFREAVISAPSSRGER